MRKEGTESVKHNGRYINIGNFKFNNGEASGYVRGRFISGNVGEYKYVCGVGGKKTPETNAKHFIIDRYESLYGDSPALRGTRSERYAATATARRIHNTHIVNLGNGTCVATGEVDGVVYSIEYNGSCEGYKGAVVEGKPWLGQARADLIEKHDNTTKATAAANVLLEIRKKDPKLVDELIKKLMIA